MKYKGVLNRRIPSRRLGLLASDAALSAEAERVADARIAKLTPLFDVYDVPIGDWPRLAFALAMAHVPGFKLSQPSGRRVTWSDVDKAELKLSVDLVMQTTRHRTVNAALNHLKKTDDEWKPRLKGIGVLTMREYYYKADPRWLKIVLDARAYDKLKGSASDAENL